MGKRKGKPSAGQTTGVTTADAEVLIPSTLTASPTAMDQSLASLFGSSLGPVKAPQRAYLPIVLNNQATNQEGTASVIDDHDNIGREGGAIIQLRSRRDSKMPFIDDLKVKRRGKRKRIDDNLEEEYMQRLRIQGNDINEGQRNENLLQEEDGTAGGKTAGGNPRGVASEKFSGNESESDPQSEFTDGEVETMDASNPTCASRFSTDFPIRHEALEQQDSKDLETAARTVFLGNVPSIAISSKGSYKILKSNFSAPGKILKIRFRSVAFSEQIPRKAAFVKHKLHEKQQTVNAYLVYETREAAREALKLNGTVVLERHIRVDSVAHPAKHDTQRSVFIGNLDFEAQEESLWRHFGSCGTIEYVRVVRDCATNIGKGFAYVQFKKNVVSVEHALLLDGKKMENGRILRVSRAKNIKRKNKPLDQARGPGSKKQKVAASQVGPRQREMLGRARKLLGKAGAAKAKKAPAHTALIFEGTRATQSSNPGIKLGSEKKGRSARARATVRSSAWKKRRT